VSGGERAQTFAGFSRLILSATPRSFVGEVSDRRFFFRRRG